MMLGKTGGNSVEKFVDPLLKSGALAVEIGWRLSLKFSTCSRAFRL